MIKNRIWFIGLLLMLGCKAQKDEMTKISYTAAELSGNFKNQGEQEVYWAKKLFNNQYKTSAYPRYKGQIGLVDENHFRYGETNIELSSLNPEFKAIFTSGLLYPKLLYPGDLKIQDMEEVKFLSNSDKVKRLKFWVFHKGFSDTSKWFMNPSVYFIELTNPKANRKTNMEDFIKGAELTYVKDGWVVI